MPEAGVVTPKTEPLQITTELPGQKSLLPYRRSSPTGAALVLKRTSLREVISKRESLLQIDPATYRAILRQRKGDLAKAQAAANIAELTVKRYQSC